MIAAGVDVSQFFTYVAEYCGVKSGWDVVKILVDVGIVAFLFYKLLHLLRDSRALQLIQGVILVLLGAIVADYAELSTISYFINFLLQSLPVLLIVIFQPDLRRALEGIGKNRLMDLFNQAGHYSATDANAMIEEVVKAASAMSRERVGALIVFERETNLSEIIRTGTIVDAKVSAQLLQLLFVPNTPLHDGAVVIRGTQVYAAACFLPLTDDLTLSRELGTRHRAGIGITETADCLSVIVSEETGAISFASNGVLTRHVTSDTLRVLLRENLVKEESKANHSRFLFWRGHKK